VIQISKRFFDNRACQRPDRPGRMWWLSLGSLVLLVFAVRLAVFSDTEPRVDQSYFASNMRLLAEADHIMPTGAHGTSFQVKLETDEKSLLYGVGRPLYTTPQEAFEAIPFILGSSFLALFGYSYTHVVALSVFASVIAFVPLTLLFRRITQTRGLPSFAAVLFYATSTYAALFSPWGVHNFGVLSFLIAVSVATPLLANSSSWTGNLNRPIGVLVGVTLLAAYSHFLNPILLPFALTLGLLTLPNLSIPRKALFAVVYGGIILVCLAPVGLLAGYVHQIQGNFLIFANVDSSPLGYLEGLPGRAGAWFVFGIHLFSGPGLVAGSAGLAGMALMTRFRLPFAVVAAHFFCYCLIPGFIWNGSNTYLRTYNYVIPFFALGMGWILLATLLPGGCLSRFVFLRLLLVGCLVWHLLIQIPLTGYRSWARLHVNDFVTDYLNGQGELRPIINEIERTAGTDPILFWGFSERFLYLSLASRTDTVAPSSLSSILEKVEHGQFLRHNMADHGYIVGTESESLTRPKLDGALSAIYRLPLRSELFRRYQNSVVAYGPLVLTYADIR
jgi:hypothetical protein